MERVAHADFEEALQGARARDLVYLDPPYTVAHGNNGFLKYNGRMFSWRDQQRLASVAKELDARGCVVFVSNAAHSSILDLYRGSFGLLTLDRYSVISGKSHGRRPVREFLFTNV